jgi:hypothetical protein
MFLNSNANVSQLYQEGTFVVCVPTLYRSQIDLTETLTTNIYSSGH